MRKIMSRQRIEKTIIWQVIPKFRPVMTNDQPLFRIMLEAVEPYP